MEDSGIVVDGLLWVVVAVLVFLIWFERFKVREDD